MCMVAEGGGSGACMMEENDGRGDGKGEKQICVMGTPNCGCPNEVTMAMDAGMARAKA